MASTLEQKIFRFNDLPTELRRQIWQYCLPQRVHELDIPEPTMLWHPPSRISCELRQSTLQNARPPALTRVCHEARQIAFETGSIPTTCNENLPADAQWISGIDIGFTWIGRNDTEHLNWTRVYEGGYGGTGHPIRCITWSPSEPTSRRASIMKDFLESCDSSELERQGFKTFKWLVVMEVMVIHKDIRSTGLFGHLGDAAIQIIDTRDFDRIATYFSYVDDNRPLSKVIEEIEYDWHGLRAYLNADNAREIHSCTRPAIMFRLCLLDCDTVELSRARIIKEEVDQAVLDAILPTLIA